MAKKAKSQTQRRSRANRNEPATFQFPDGGNGLLPFTSTIASIRSSESLKRVLEVLDLRMDEFGRMLGKTPQFSKRRPEGFSKGYVSQLSGGKRVPSRAMLNAIGVVLSREITAMLGVEIGVSVHRNSPWHFRLAANCARHGPYELSGNRKHCPKCKK